MINQTRKKDYSQTKLKGESNFQNNIGNNPVVFR